MTDERDPTARLDSRSREGTAGEDEGEDPGREGSELVEDQDEDRDLSGADDRYYPGSGAAICVWLAAANDGEQLVFFWPLGEGTIRSGPGPRHRSRRGRR